MIQSAIEADHYYKMGQVVQVSPGEFTGDPYTYCDGVITSLLRSGVDGPHSRLADRLCGLSGRYYE